jgi:CRISPR-associated endonuclease/helicase Cas3
VEAYFRLLYWKKGAEHLDRHGVLAACEDAVRSLDFPFERIADSVRLIDEAMAPIIVPAEDDGEAAPLLEKLRFAERPGRIARRLQRFTVGVPQRVRADLCAKKLAEAVEPGRFGDQFVRLVHLDLYRPDVGLDWDDPTFMESGRLIG